MCVEGNGPRPSNHHETMTTTTTTSTSNPFISGKRYTMRYACDADSQDIWLCVKTTAKTATFMHNDPSIGTKTCRLKSDWQGGFFVMPLGNYSMAPCIKPGNVIA